MANISSKKLLTWFLIIFISVNIIWIAEYYSLSNAYYDVVASSEKTVVNNNVLVFTQMFVNKVLKSDKEVNFETRLQLENAVRNIKDETVLGKWKAFIDAKTEAEAQDRVKDLLDILVNKIKI